jgi:hypothetical protein
MLRFYFHVQKRFRVQQDGAVKDKRIKKKGPKSASIALEENL